MIKRQIIDGHNSYERISKSTAAKRYAHGLPVYLIAHKLRPGRPFSFGLNLLPETDCEGKMVPFGERVQNYEWYNCSYETGYYSAFYVETPGSTSKQGERGK